MKGSTDFQKLYEKLNQNQKKAVDTIDGPVLVLAGPGTGKTQVLTMRVANILLKTDSSPDEILALTFTESGVRAMRERLISIVGTEAYHTNIYTFHSFCSDIIRSNPDEFIISTQTEALSDLERVHLFKELFDKFNLKHIKPFNAPYFYLQTAISKIKDLKREGIDPGEYEQFIKKTPTGLEEKDVNKNLDLITIYKEYEKRLKEIGRYDFEDMINFVVEKFKTSPALLQKYQERFQYFLVDEFQDTNSAQSELLYLLSSYWGDNANLFVVGDDDQSIYRFQGASIENILRFNQKYPSAKKITLDINYRSSQPILDASENVIKNNTLRISSKLKLDKSQKSVAVPKSSKVITKSDFSSSHIENFYIAKEIQKLIKSGVSQNEIAVIYRNNADSLDISDMLSRMDIRYTLEGGENVLESGVIVRLLHLLQVILKIRTKDEDLDLFTLLNYEFLNVDALDVLKISRFATTNKQNLFEAIENPNIKTVQLKNFEKITEFIEKVIYWNELSFNVTFVEFLDAVINESNYLNWILNHRNSYEYLNKLNSFLSEVKRLNYSNKSLLLDDFLQYIDLMNENRIPINEATIDIETNAVKLMTAHKAKGLEFEYVFITKFIDRKWSNAIIRDLIKIPTSILKTVEIKDDKQRRLHQLEDERRLFYVSLTRAKKHLYITSSKNYQSGIYSKECVESMFLHELPEKNIVTVSSSEYEKSASEVLKQLLKPQKADHVITESEKAFLVQTLKDFKISPSSLNTYIECPYKFKLEFLFKTPRPQIKAFAMGTGVHKALEEAYKILKQSKEVTLKFLCDEYEKEVQKEILTKNELEELILEGRDILKIYFETYEHEFKTNAEHVLYLEKFFGWGWSKPLLDDEIHLSGKVDKIEIIDESEKLVKIVDYKTGRPKSRKEILGETKYSVGNEYRQLVFYKLLVELDRSLNLKVKEVEIDFTGNRTRNPKRESFIVEEEDTEDLKNIIREVYKNIKELRFERTSNYSVCSNCRYKYHCWPDGIPSRSEGQLELDID